MYKYDIFDTQTSGWRVSLELRSDVTRQSSSYLICKMTLLYPLSGDGLQFDVKLCFVAWSFTD